MIDWLIAMLGLRFCARAFSSCGKRGPLFITVRGLLTIAASLVAEHRLQMRRLSNCGSRAQPLRGMWDLPRPGHEPVCPALAGRFPTTAPPGKSTSAFWSSSFTLWLPTLMVNKRAVSTRWRLPPSISRLPPKEYIFMNLLLKSKETSFPNISGKCFCILWTSLVVQWLEIRLPMQGTRVRALVREDPTCRGATKPVRHNYWACALEPTSHNYWARAPRARALQQEKPPQWEARAAQRRAAPARCN